MQPITRDLWIGSASEWQPHMRRFCVAVEVNGHDLPLIDDEQNPDELVLEAVRRLDKVMRAANGPVLLCCVHGISRSPYIAALWLSWYLDMPWEWAVGYVKVKRPLSNIHPAHMRQAERILERLRNG